MLYLLDACVLITANNSYYPIDQVPEFWEWLQYQGCKGNVKMPLEMIEEILDGKKDGDRLLEWLGSSENKSSIVLQDDVDPLCVQRVVEEGYASDLNDIEIISLGRDPFLVAHALAVPGRCVVTTEISKPKKQRHNKKVPDVCQLFGLTWCDTFALNRSLGFHTAWRNLTKVENR